MARAVPDSVTAMYLSAKRAVIEAGYEFELAAEEVARRREITEPILLREIAWVILSSGMSEKVIRRLFSRVSDCCFGWTSAAAIAARADECQHNLLMVFNNQRKISAIIAAAREIDRRSAAAIVHAVRERGPEALRYLPYIGPVTALHLAKNLGCDVAKPDRHLVRIAEMCECVAASDLCAGLGKKTGDPVAIVDYVLWRFATLSRSYLRQLQDWRQEYETTRRIRPPGSSERHRALAS